MTLSAVPSLLAKNSAPGTGRGRRKTAVWRVLLIYLLCYNSSLVTFHSQAALCGKLMSPVTITLLCSSRRVLDIFATVFFTQSASYFCSPLIRLAFSQQSFMKVCNIKFDENLSIGSREGT